MKQGRYDLGFRVNMGAIHVNINFIPEAEMSNWKQVDDSVDFRRRMNNKIFSELKSHQALK